MAKSNKKNNKRPRKKSGEDHVKVPDDMKMDVLDITKKIVSIAKDVIVTASAIHNFLS